MKNADDEKNVDALDEKLLEMQQSEALSSAPSPRPRVAELEFLAKIGVQF